MDVGKVPVSTLALSGHKLYGPQGVEALLRARGVSIEPLLFGGGQGRGLRSGTETVAAIVGLAAAARLAREEMGERVRHEEELRDRIPCGRGGDPGRAGERTPEQAALRTTYTSSSRVWRPRGWCFPRCSGV